MDDFMADLQRAITMVENMPPSPHAIRMHHSVPVGRIFRQWDTRGRLFIWANPSVYDEMKHTKYGPIDIAAWDILSPAVIGVPVWHG